MCSGVSTDFPVGGRGHDLKNYQYPAKPLHQMLPVFVNKRRYAVLSTLIQMYAPAHRFVHLFIDLQHPQGNTVAINVEVMIRKATYYGKEMGPIREVEVVRWGTN